MEKIKAWTCYTSQTIFFIDYLFYTDDIIYEKSVSMLRSFRRKGKDLYLVTELAKEKDEVIIFEEVKEEFLASFDEATQTFTFDEKGMKAVREAFNTIANRGELAEFLRKSLQHNLVLYKIMFCDSQFASDICRVVREESSVGGTIITNIFKNGLLALEKVITGCGRNFFTQNIYKEDFELANDRKKLRQVLGLPPAVLDFLKISRNAPLYGKFKKVADTRDVNDCSTIIEYINLMEELESFTPVRQRTSIASFVETLLDISLLAPTTKMQTIINYLHNQEASFKDGVGLLLPNSEAIEMRDYLSIAKKNGIVVDPLPANLKAAHFYIISNTKYSEDKEKDEEFAKAVDVYKHLEEEGEDYVVIAPKSIKDMVVEGQNQHHCIASYVDMVCAKKAIVLFLRKKESPEESFISFEVTEDGEFVQIKGKYDADIEPDGAENSQALDYLVAWRARKWKEEE